MKTFTDILQEFFLDLRNIVFIDLSTSVLNTDLCNVILYACFNN